MREYDDIRRLIVEEQTQNPYEREALNEVVELLAEGPLEASARDDYREVLRLRLVAEAGRVMRGSRLPWFRRPLAMSAAAALVLALTAGATALRLQDRRTGSPVPAHTPAALQGAPSNDDTSKSLATQEHEPTLGIATVPAPSAGAAYGPDVPSSGAVASRGLVRPAQRDAAMVRVAPGAAAFQLEATLPAVGAELPAYKMRQVAPTALDVKAVAEKLALGGEVQEGYGHLWVGEPVSSGSAPGPGLPPYKAPGHWLVASPDWGNGWTYSYRDDKPADTPSQGGISQTDAEQAARSFLRQVGLVRGDTTDLRLTVRLGERGAYQVDVNLVLNGRDIRDATGALRLDQNGRIVYASWPFLTVSPAGVRPVISADEALAVLRSMPFDWYSGDPKLTITQVDLVYRWPLLTAAERESDVAPAYEFSVHDADGNQSVLYVPAWR